MTRNLPAAAGILALAAASLFAVPAPAQTPATPAQPQADDSAGAPLQTMPRPEDRTATDPVPVTPGAGGDAPSDEMTEMGDPVQPGRPDADAIPNDAPADLTGRGAQQSREADTALPAVPPEPVIVREDAERLVGRPVLGSDGRELGTVRDFVLVQPGDGIGHVVVALEQPGGGERLVAVPAEHITRAEEAVEIDAGAEDLAEAFPFDYGPGTDALIGPDP